MTPRQIRMYMDRLPDVAYRANYMLAKLSAAVKNAVGGKPDPSKPSKGETTKPELLYTPEEELPWFARPPEQRGVSPQTARTIMAHRKSLPRWARKLVDFQAMERIGLETAD